MVSATHPGDDAVAHFVKKAIDIGATEIEVEYESGREHVFAVAEYSGVEIASLDAKETGTRAPRSAVSN